ncbi:MAG: efflux RND transporter periplasmic adaptor subunit [Rhodanobacter sp.]
MKCRRAFALLVLASAIVATAACSSKTEGDAPTASATPGDVRLTPAQRQNIHLHTVASAGFHKTVEASGAVDFDNDQATSVLAPFSGPVSRLLVNPGDRVKKGDALAIVDSPDFATAISTYRKALATAHTNRRLADLEKDLLQHRGVAQREEDQAQTDAANADADLEAALQGLVALDVDPKIIRDIQQGRSVARVQSVIRAPIGGTVVEKLITPGQLLQAGTTACFTIADLSRVWVLAQVSASDLASVSVGDRAEVETGIDAKKLAGTVTNIAALVSPDTRLVAARVVVENPGALLKKQMYVDVLIHSGRESNGLLIPVAAVLRDDENLPFVYVSQHDGSFARRQVTLGYRTDDQYNIVAGLQAGDQVVTDGGIFVQFMQNQ